MKKNTKNKISQIDKILMNNEKQNIITAFSMILLAIFAPLKSFVAQWLIDSPSIKTIFLRFDWCGGSCHESYLRVYCQKHV